MEDGENTLVEILQHADRSFQTSQLLLLKEIVLSFMELSQFLSLCGLQESLTEMETHQVLIRLLVHGTGWLRWG